MDTRDYTSFIAEKRHAPGHKMGLTDGAASRSEEEQELLNRGIDHRTVLDAAMNAMIVTEFPSGRVVEINDACLRAVGISRKEAIGSTPLSLGVWENLADRDRCLSELELTGRIAEQEVSFLFKGKSVPYVISARLLGSGPVRYAFWELRDISEEKKMKERLVSSREKVKALLIESEQSRRALLNILEDEQITQEALRASEERYRLLAENMADVLWILDLDSMRFTYVSPSVEKLRGYTATEVLSQSMDEALTARSAAYLSRVLPDRTRAFTSGEPNSGRYLDEIQQPRKDGTTVWTDVSTTYLRNKRGGIDLIGVSRDITERKRAEEQLQKLSLAVEQSPASIIITDTRGNIEYVNPKFTQVTGYALHEILGQNPRILKSGEKSAEEYRKLWNTITSGSVWRGEFHNKKKNGELFWEMASISPVTSKENVVTNFVAVKEDITERKRAEETLRQAQKLESLGTLAGGIAHDFNNVLGGIMGYTDMSLRYAEKGSVLERNLLKVLKVADRAKHLIQQILTFSRKGNPHPAVTLLKPIVVEVLELLKASIPSSVVIKAELQKETKPVLADPVKIHEALLNLATNGVHAMENKGTLRFTLRGELLENPIYGHTGEIPAGEYTVIDVADDGCGMDETTLSKAFEPFFTTKAIGKGTGMGLSVVLGVVQSTGGGVRVATAPGEGAKFSLYFPVTREAALRPINEESLTEYSGTERILFVDDEPMLLETARDLLTPLGYRLTCLTDGLEALKFIRERGEQIDLVITDQTMPGMTGIELAKEVRARRPDLPVILSTGFSSELNPDRVASTGIAHVVMKPFRYNELAQLIRKLVDEREEDADHAQDLGNR
ncbi:MAG TPA: PAS domain S-box protein [Bacteroidota bacterium]|nr:PAS domain S-box protein [Bacteroidota bacterium]